MLWFSIIGVGVGIRVGIDIDIGFNEDFCSEIFLIGQPRSHTDGFFYCFGSQGSNIDHQTSAMMPLPLAMFLF